MPAQRTSMSACHVSGHPSDSSQLPPFTRQLALVSTRLTPTLDGRPATSADSGPTTSTAPSTAPHTASPIDLLTLNCNERALAILAAGQLRKPDRSLSIDQIYTRAQTGIARLGMTQIRSLSQEALRLRLSPNTDANKARLWQIWRSRWQMHLATDLDYMYYANAPLTVVSR